MNGGDPLPTATYRLQLGAHFGFEDARRLIPYLRDLGISHLYLSPVFRSTPGSAHGYDVTDPARVDPALGGREGFDALSEAAREAGMGMLLDFVPNHMAAHHENPWWWDVLKFGTSSAHAYKFDITWQPPLTPLYNRVLLPVLGGPMEELAAKGEIRVRWHAGAFEVHYYEHRFPVNPVTYFELLDGVPHATRQKYPELRKIIEAFSGLAHADTVDRTRALAEEKRFAEWVGASPGHIRVIEEAVRSAADPSFLTRFLHRQPYILAFWRRAAAEINYRRFFDVNELICLRMHDKTVFEEVHRELFRLLQDGCIEGVRIDHVDGLTAPKAYLSRLRSAGVPWLLVEKILSGDESLPPEWETEGTTGYEFIRAAEHALLDPDGLERLGAVRDEFSAPLPPFNELVLEKKELILNSLFRAETDALAFRLAEIGAGNPDTQPGTEALREAVVTLTAALGVYRTYGRTGPMSGNDQTRIHEAARRAEALRPGLDPDALRITVETALHPERSPAHAEWLDRWQLLTGPAMAMGLENCAFFNHDRLISLNEVGGEPAESAEGAVSRFHEFNATRTAKPRTLNAGSTHDTKLSADARARLHVLSWIPDEWSRRVKRWKEWNHGLCPDPAAEYFLYQAMLAVWPLRSEEEDSLPERLSAYALKAAREARRHTSWIDNDPAYEEALTSFVHTALGEGRPFREDLREFAARLAWPGAVNSLSQIVLRALSPGVPDFYQGEEDWRFSLVDPDNRRPVDFRAARERLGAARKTEAASLPRAWRDGRLKALVIDRLLHLRGQDPELFLQGTYEPCKSENGRAIGFVRRHNDRAVMALVPKCWITGTNAVTDGRLGEAVLAENLTLPGDAPARWQSVFTGESHELGREGFAFERACGGFPVGVLHS